MTHTIEVENIKCGDCVNSITNALMKIADVLKVDIDKEVETITIESSQNMSVFLEPLSKMGYPEKGKNTVLRKPNNIKYNFKNAWNSCESSTSKG